MATPGKVPTLFFVTYGAGHADIVRRLYPCLQGVDGLRVEVLALTTAVNVLNQYEIPHRTLSDLFPLDGYEEAQAKGHALSESIWNPESGIARIDSDLYLGASMVDLEMERGEAVARRLYAEEGRKAFCPVRLMKRVLETVEPHAVVITCLVRMEKAALLAARDLGVHTVLIEDLFGYSLLGEEEIERGSLQLPVALLPDDVVVMNDGVADRLINHGVPRSRVHALGQPVFSEWMEEFEQAAPDRHFDHFKGDRVAYIAPAREDVLLDHTRSICDLAAKRPDVAFYFKLHPSTPRSWLLSRVRDIPENVLVSRDLDLASIIKVSDTVIVFRSSVGLLTLMAGKRLVVFDHTGEPETLPYVASGAAPLATSEQELAALIGPADEVAGQSTTAFVPPLFRSPTGATARIAGFLVNVVMGSAGLRNEANL